MQRLAIASKFVFVTSMCSFDHISAQIKLQIKALEGQIAIAIDIENF